MRSCRPSSAVLKTTAFTVRASAEQARRWARVARYLGFRGVGSWLEDTAEIAARRVESFMPPSK